MVVEDGSAPSYSADGKWLIYNANAGAVRADIWYTPLGQDPSPVALTQSTSNDFGAVFSTNGAFVAYGSWGLGRDNVFVQRFPGGEGKWQVSSSEGVRPRWNPRGGELFYVNHDRMMVARVVFEPSFSLGTPEVLFTIRRGLGYGGAVSYDVDPDGKRFVMVRSAGEEADLPGIVVVQNWFAEFAERP